MKMLYTANGRYIRCCTEEGTRPVIIVCEKEYEVDVQEFMLWSILNWRILREEEIAATTRKWRAIPTSPSTAAGRTVCSAC